MPGHPIGTCAPTQSTHRHVRKGVENAHDAVDEAALTKLGVLAREHKLHQLEGGALNLLHRRLRHASYPKGAELIQKILSYFIFFIIINVLINIFIVDF